MFRGMGLGSSQPYKMTGRGGEGRGSWDPQSLVFSQLCHSPVYITLFPLSPLAFPCPMRSQLPGWEPQSPVLLQSRGSVGTSGPGNER